MHVAYCPFGFEAIRPIRQFFHALLHALREFPATNWAAVSKFYGFLRGKGDIAVSVTCPMILAVSRIGFDGEIEALRVLLADGVNHLLIG